MKKITFHVSGTHCASCKILIEDILHEHAGIDEVKVDLKTETITIQTTLDENPRELAEELTEKIRHRGYELSLEKKIKEENKKGLIWKALPIGLTFLALFFGIQKSGILNFGFGGKVTPVTSFIIGLIASISSCLAVVGGLVLSLAATVSQDSIRDTKPIVLFHSGRLISFILLGGVLGAIGGVIGISFTVSALLGVVASLVMILLGLNLVGIFDKKMIALPPGVFSFFRTIEHKTIAPFLVGFGTFFLPCGFTQAMQVAALSSGSFMSGAVLMAAFAFGTLPMLSFLSFGSASFAQSTHAPLFFRSAGVVVIGLGVFSLLAGLAGLGIIDPLFTL